MSSGNIEEMKPWRLKEKTKDELIGVILDIIRIIYELKEQEKIYINKIRDLKCRLPDRNI